LFGGPGDALHKEGKTEPKRKGNQEELRQKRVRKGRQKELPTCRVPSLPSRKEDLKEGDKERSGGVILRGRDGVDRR